MPNGLALCFIAKYTWFYGILHKPHLDMYTLKLFINFVAHMTFHVSKLKFITRKFGNFLLTNLVKKYPIWTYIKKTIQSFWTSQFQHIHCDWGGFFTNRVWTIWLVIVTRHFLSIFLFPMFISTLHYKTMRYKGR
jgi:hypothetical protein